MRSAASAATAATEEDRVKVFRDLSHEHLAEIQAAQRDNENGETRYGL
jgi:hypothetical protein